MTSRSPRDSIDELGQYTEDYGETLRLLSQSPNQTRHYYQPYSNCHNVLAVNESMLDYYQLWSCSECGEPCAIHLDSQPTSGQDLGDKS